jgi:RimJ/RimL family protein N-acetyltransferase
MLPAESTHLDGPIISIRGALVGLGPLSRAHLPLFQRWMNDFDVRRTVSRVVRPLTWADQLAWYEEVTSDPHEIQFAIYELASVDVIGATGLHGVDHRNRTAEYGIFIAKPGARGRGYGSEVTRLMLDDAFTVRDLHSVWLQVFAFNLAGIRAYQNAGFREFGRRREGQLLGGTWHDIVYMDCQASEFTSSQAVRDG